MDQANQGNQVIQTKVLWKPFKIFNCLPCIGHIAIENSKGERVDFRDNQVVGLNLYKLVGKEVLLPIKNPQMLDEGIEQYRKIYTNELLKESQYRHLTNNCHHFVANILNYANKSKQFSAFSLMLQIHLNGKRVGQFSGFNGFVKIYYQFIILITFQCVLFWLIFTY